MTIFYSGKVNVYDDVPADKVFKLGENWELHQITLISLFPDMSNLHLFRHKQSCVLLQALFVCLQKLLQMLL